ncbi:MAG TPA: ABC transporter permease [Methylocella sp.]|nr:ABC transporter permease [Methylocella sp.]
MSAIPISEANERFPVSPLAINAAVIRAILLRDIRLRAGPYYLGFVAVLLYPLVHLLIILTVKHIIGKIAPQGTSDVIYFGLSVLPFVILLHNARQIMSSILQNKPLLFFNRVTVLDILIARGILESIGAIVVSFLFFCLIALYTEEFSPRDWTGMLFAIAATIYLSFSFAVVNTLISRVYPIWQLFISLFIVVLYLSSGVLFFPAAVPDPYAQWLAFNPLLQCVEWLRSSYYDDYPDKLLNIPYLLSFTTVCLTLGLAGDRLARRILASK